MHFEFMTVEVDGTLNNPVVVQAVLLWSAVLALWTIATLKFWRERRRLVLAVLAGAYVVPPLGQFIIGNVIYRLQDPRILSVGFWGGPPIWIAPLAGAMAGGIVLVARRWVRSSEAA